jgi:predicted TIM-barrel fold metal-dependent hydrolase
MLEWGHDMVHPAAHTPSERIKLMDEIGVYAQVTFPNSIGLGGQSLASQDVDRDFMLMCLQIYNDALAEVQAEANGRLMPMPVLPAWSVEESVREATRVAELGLHGVNMTTDPQDLGSPDLANRAWDPLWEACEALQLPVHFHIGASLTAMNFYSEYMWESQDEYVKPAIGGTMLFINNARVLINVILCGMLDRYPDLQLVSVESGIGWIPFILEALDYEVYENAPVQFGQYELKPSEYFARNWHATFWFEENHGDLQALVDRVGDDKILFETDFPHPTCLYPDPLGTIEPRLATLRPESRRRILGENAAALYRL